MFLFLIAIAFDEIKTLLFKQISAYFRYDLKSLLALTLKLSRAFQCVEHECLVASVTALWER
ncbi:MAG: hypothetical protein EBT19_01805 [Methylocystaceae bacterium]|nr:hypothetical protein [Methylocystaceae bacterium]NBV94135.1 hypothetical protein [Methylocystaceae bacterium]